MSTPTFSRAHNDTTHGPERHQCPVRLQRWQGPWKISDTNETMLVETWLDAGCELDYKVITAVAIITERNRSACSVTCRQTFTTVIERQNTAEVYLRPAMYRDNLDIVTHAHVTKVNIVSRHAVGWTICGAGACTLFILIGTFRSLITFYCGGAPNRWEYSRMSTWLERPSHCKT